MSEQETYKVKLKPLTEKERQPVLVEVYPNDDGPLTDVQMEAIRATSPVSNLSDERITRRLF